ncbi:MAG TPA: histidine phosphatase family protein [Kiritimatiellia bacterium]|nr:histidine phosphatase family protein [Kiritimatiellia bacterium]HRU71198.1 histidine phosphatase family protein [Kiritimatiellia bacterium]
MKTSLETLDLPQIRAKIDQGCRVALLLRHSERPPIPTDDKDFGRRIGLTPRGIEMARAAGSHLAGIRDARFFASPMARCQLTARHIAEGMGLPDATVTDAEQLGVRGFFYEDCYAVQAAMQQRGYMAFMLDYLRNGTAPYSRPIGPATDDLAEWLRHQTTTRLGIFISHDIFVASFLTGLKIRTYTAEDWVGFLHGAALFEAPDGTWTCRACVPELRVCQEPAAFAD